MRGSKRTGIGYYYENWFVGENVSGEESMERRRPRLIPESANGNGRKPKPQLLADGSSSSSSSCRQLLSRPQAPLLALFTSLPPPAFSVTAVTVAFPCSAGTAFFLHSLCIASFSLFPSFSILPSLRHSPFSVLLDGSAAALPPFWRCRLLSSPSSFSFPLFSSSFVLSLSLFSLLSVCV
ncbi:hypothetical protein PIB30_077827, partial [Stylosanthes scabra]|nr:hypothetical protein [Stylosanthes scabra]